MKRVFIALILYSVLISSFIIRSGFSLKNKELEVVSNLDLHKFQGTWYEITHNPWFPEKDCFSMIAHYKLTEDSQTEVTNICRKNGSDGEISKVSGKAWLVSPKINSQWEV